MTTDTDTLREALPTQEDRDAAGDLWTEHLGWSNPDPNDGAAAEMLESIAHAFARYRLATLSKPEPAAVGEDHKVIAKKIWADTFVSHPYHRGDTWVPQQRALAAVEKALLYASPVPSGGAASEARDRVIMSSVRLGKWMSAALDDPNVCDEMKADIREWFSAGEPVEGWTAAIAPSPSSEAISPPDGLERFADDVQDVHSRIIIVHQLRASADIQDDVTQRRTGWATTSDRAQLMRKAANTIEALACACPPDARAVVECDVCHGSGKNTVSQLWPDYPPPCRVCGGKGALPTPTETPTAAAPDDGLTKAQHMLRMVAAHASGGHLENCAGMSLNDICVAISQHHNRVWEGGIEKGKLSADDGLMGRYRDDFQRIIEECEAGRWSNAIDIARSALSTATGDEGGK